MQYKYDMITFTTIYDNIETQIQTIIIKVNYWVLMGVVGWGWELWNCETLNKV